MRNFIKYFLPVLIIPLVFVVGCQEKEEVLTPATVKREVTLKADHDTLTALMPSTSIYFGIPEDSYVFINITNSRKQQSKILINNIFFNAGTYIWTADMSSMASGVYYYNIVLGSSLTNDNQLSQITYMKSRKMVLIK